MKLSVSLSDEDVEYLDAYTESQGLQSRSAALQKAVRLLRASELGAAYEGAWLEWAESDDGELWDAATADGLV
ncbi:MAG: antitoxin [Acidimicrobiia bacterium]|nr:antitoxin [Acidimicrobiia bacterium]